MMQSRFQDPSQSLFYICEATDGSACWVLSGAGPQGSADGTGEAMRAVPAKKRLAPARTGSSDCSDGPQKLARGLVKVTRPCVCGGSIQSQKAVY